jgi:hypothetical protein
MMMMIFDTPPSKSTINPDSSMFGEDGTGRWDGRRHKRAGCWRGGLETGKEKGERSCSTHWNGTMNIQDDCSLQLEKGECGQSGSTH